MLFRGLFFAIFCWFAVASHAAVNPELLSSETHKRFEKVPEFEFIIQEANKLGVKVYLFGGTASAFAHYVRWDLEREAGDDKYQEERFDYDFTNIYRGNQDLDIVVDGNPQQAAALRSVLAQNFPHFMGDREAWEVRLLRHQIGDKQPLLNDWDFKNQHTDTNSTGLLLLNPEGDDLVYNDLFDWGNPDSSFLSDVAEDRITFLYSSNHHKTGRFQEGLNPPFLSALRYLAKLAQYEVKGTEEDLKTIIKIIEDTDLSKMSNYAAKKASEFGLKTLLNAPDSEYAWNLLKKTGARKKLIEMSHSSGDRDLEWWMNKEPLRTRELGKAGRTAKEIFNTDDIVISHETNNFEAYENITRSAKGGANVFISRQGVRGEAAVDGNGFYTLLGRRGARDTGLTARFKLHPEAREGYDFDWHDRVVIVKNKKAITLIQENLNLSMIDFLSIVSKGGFSNIDRGIWIKFQRKFNRVRSDSIEFREARDFIKGFIFSDQQGQTQVLSDIAEAKDFERLLEIWLQVQKELRAQIAAVISSDPEKLNLNHLKSILNYKNFDDIVVKNVFSLPKWSDYGDMMLVILQKNQVSPETLKEVLNLAQWKNTENNGLIKFIINFKIAQNDSASEYYLKSGLWKKHPEYLGKFIKMRPELGDDFKKYVLSDPEVIDYIKWILDPLINSSEEKAQEIGDILGSGQFHINNPEWFESVLKSYNDENIIKVMRFMGSYLNPKYHAHLPEMFVKLLKKDHEKLPLIKNAITYVFSKPDWTNRAELLKVFFGLQQLNDVLLENIFLNPVWKNQTEIFIEFFQKSNIDVSKMREVINKNHPEKSTKIFILLVKNMEKEYNSYYSYNLKKDHFEFLISSDHQVNKRTSHQESHDESNNESNDEKHEKNYDLDKYISIVESLLLAEDAHADEFIVEEVFQKLNFSSTDKWAVLIRKAPYEKWIEHLMKRHPPGSRLFKNLFLQTVSSNLLKRQNIENLINLGLQAIDDQVDDAILERLLVRPHLKINPNWVRKLINRKKKLFNIEMENAFGPESSSLRSIEIFITKGLSQPQWSKHPDLVDAFLESKHFHYYINKHIFSVKEWSAHTYLAVKYLEESTGSTSTFNLEHWQGRSEIMEVFIDKGHKYDISRYFVTSDNWPESILNRMAQNPDLHKELLLYLFKNDLTNQFTSLTDSILEYQFKQSQERGSSYAISKAVDYIKELTEPKHLEAIKKLITFQTVDSNKNRYYMSAIFKSDYWKDHPDVIDEILNWNLSEVNNELLDKFVHEAWPQDMDLFEKVFEKVFEEALEEEGTESLEKLIHLVLPKIKNPKIVIRFMNTNKGLQNMVFNLLDKEYWIDYPEVISAFIKKGRYLSALATYVLSHSHWIKHPHLINEFMDKAGEGALQSLIGKVLSEPWWVDHPDFVSRLIKEEKLHFTIAKDLLSKSHWAKYPHLMSDYIKEEGNLHYLAKYALSQPYWVKHPHLIDEYIEAADDMDLNFLFDDVLSAEHWVQHPHLMTKLFNAAKEKGSDITSGLFGEVFSQPYGVKYKSLLLDILKTDSRASTILNLKSILTKEHWFDSPELLEHLIENSSFQKDILIDVLSYEHWSPYPEFLDKVLQSVRGTKEDPLKKGGKQFFPDDHWFPRLFGPYKPRDEIDIILSRQPHWVQNPEVQSYLQGKRLTLKNWLSQEMSFEEWKRSQSPSVFQCSEVL